MIWTLSVNFAESESGRGLWALIDSGHPLAETLGDLTEKQKAFIIQSYYLKLEEDREFLAGVMGAELKKGGSHSGRVRREALRRAQKV